MTNAYPVLECQRRSFQVAVIHLFPLHRPGVFPAFNLYAGVFPKTT